MDRKELIVRNCRLFNSSGDELVSISIRDGVIIRIGEPDPEVSSVRSLDAEGRVVAPGFIDVHIQGAGGGDVLDGSPEALQAISRTCARFGTTSFLATTVFRPKGDNRHIGVAAENVGRDLGGADLLGIHLEGPFISPEKRGMIRPDCICSPSKEILGEILELTGGTLRIMTIAPELKGSLGIIEELRDRGIVPSLGHTSASYEETLEGIKAGISHVTHLFNAMASFHHRNPGPLLAIFESEDLDVQIITDGVHLHPKVLRWAFNLIGPRRSITITDGMQAMGLPEGRYIYNGIEYESRDGTARYADGTLIGTSMGLNRMIERLMEFTGCPLDVAIRTVTENPARAIGMEDRKGSIEVGKDGDLVILDPDLSIWATIVGGRIVYRKEEI
ncbi:N-acetylglucosamine-6-phosphate deacetylase [Candidatus Poribacteria bacterium]|nr:N-acetylglucosamine-6-phosphate deacetylase [Candidatus Poribacteria bacterium]